MEIEVESIVLAMWDDPEEEIAREVMSRFDISFEQASELVNSAILKELEASADLGPDEAQEWYDFDPDC